MLFSGGCSWGGSGAGVPKAAKIPGWRHITICASQYFSFTKNLVYFFNFHSNPFLEQTGNIWFHFNIVRGSSIQNSDTLLHFSRRKSTPSVVDYNLINFARLNFASQKIAKFFRFHFANKGFEKFHVDFISRMRLKTVEKKAIFCHIENFDSFPHQKCDFESFPVDLISRVINLKRFREF